MEDLLIATLGLLGYPVMLQGSLSENEDYPESFFTFWNPSSEGRMHYDNTENSILYDYDVNFYSTDAVLVYTAIRKAKAALKAAGFIVTGDGFSVPVDNGESHDGRGINVKYLGGN